MRIASVVALLTALVLPTCLAASPYNTTTRPVFTSMLVADMDQLLKSMASSGLEVATFQLIQAAPVYFVHYLNGVLSLRLRNPVTVETYENGVAKKQTAYESILFYTILTNSESLYACDKINEWNRTHSGSRAYLGSDGTPTLESDLFLEGGVTLETVKGALNMFGVSFMVFATFLKT